MAEEKRYLDYDGLAHLVEKLNNKIEASGSGGDYLPLTGGTLTGDLVVGGDLQSIGELKVDTRASYFAGGTYIDTSGHIHLPSGVEIY